MVHVVIGKAPASFFNFPSSWPRQAGLFPLESLGTNEALFTLFNDSTYKTFHFGSNVPEVASPRGQLAEARMCGS